MHLGPLFINGRFLTQRITGTQRYAHEILTRLDAMMAPPDQLSSQPSSAPWPAVHILVPRDSSEMSPYKHLKVSTVGRRTGRLWEQIELPYHARGGVLFTPCGGAPILHRRNIVTIHDAAVFASPAGYAPLYRIWYRWLYRALCHTALHVFTVSNFSRSELIKYCRADLARLTVTYLGSEHAAREPADPAILAEWGVRAFQYVFTVSSRAPNKNLDGLLAAFSHFPAAKLDLVLAGARNARVFPKPNHFDSAVIDLGYISEAALRALYENAACFVFPSLYEGFGLPPLEALALGCPAVVSDANSLGEIFRPVATLCDPHDARDIAARIVEAMQATPEHRDRCRQFAHGFSWDECAEVTWRRIAAICGQQYARHKPSPGISGARASSAKTRTVAAPDA